MLHLKWGWVIWLMAPILVIAGILYFAASVTILHLLRPDVNPLTDGISFYGTGPYSAVMNTAFFAIGLSGLLLAVGLDRATAAARPPRAGLFLMGAWGLAQFLAGLFPLDLPGASPTTAGTVHTVVGFNFLLIAVASVVVSRSFEGEKQGLLRSATLMAWVVPFMSVLLFVFEGLGQPLGIGGIVQRAYWVAIALWLGTTSFRLRHRSVQPKLALEH